MSYDLSLRKWTNSNSQPCQQILLFSESSSVNHNYDLYFYSFYLVFSWRNSIFYYRISKGGCKISSRIKYPLRKLKPNISLTYTRGRYLQIVDELLFKDDSKLFQNTKLPITQWWIVKLHLKLTSFCSIFGNRLQV